MVIHWSKESVKQFEKIYDYLAKHFSIEKSEEFYTEFIQKVEHIKTFPHAGKISEKNILVREIIFMRNTLYYKILTEQEILIVTIRHRKDS